MLRLAHGKASALDIELVESLALAVNEIAASDARAAILTGTGSIFSAGVDLFRLVDGGREYAERFVPALSRMILDLFSLPKAVVVAANGHAIAGGCILALAGDYRIMAEGKGRMGMPELLVGVPFPPAVVEVIRFAVPSRNVQMLMYGGATFTADEALRLGMVDDVTLPDALLGRAESIAQELASLPPRAFALAKRQLRDQSIRRAKRYSRASSTTRCASSGPTRPRTRTSASTWPGQ